jgi:hypothetical protein
MGTKKPRQAKEPAAAGSIEITEDIIPLWPDGKQRVPFS